MNSFLTKNLYYILGIIIGMSLFIPLALTNDGSPAPATFATTAKNNTQQLKLGDKVVDEALAFIDMEVNGNWASWSSSTDIGWQLHLLYLPTLQTIELYSPRNNVNADHQGIRTVWESQIDGHWQIMYFDGVKVSQVTNDPIPHQQAVLTGDKITYEAKIEDVWKKFKYDITSKQSESL